MTKRPENIAITSSIQPNPSYSPMRAFHVLVKIKYSYAPMTDGGQPPPEPDQKHFFVKADSAGEAITLVSERLIPKSGWEIEPSYTVKAATWIGDGLVNSAMPEGSEIYSL